MHRGGGSSVVSTYIKKSLKFREKKTEARDETSRVHYCDLGGSYEVLLEG